MTSAPALDAEVLRDGARRFAADRFSLDALRRLRAASPEALDGLRATWREMAALGWAGLVVPEDRGGSGGTMAAVAVVAEELGRALAVTPLVACGVVTARALAASPGGAAALEPLCAGASLVVPARVEGASAASPEAAIATAGGDGRYLVRGRKAHVPLGPVADAFLVTATVPGDDVASLFLVARGAPGLDVVPGVLIDSQPVAALAFDQVEAALVARAGAATTALADADVAGLVALSAWMSGAASRALEVTLEHLRTRVQFGVPIGAFQALQHRAAQLHCDVVLSRAVTTRAAEMLDADDAAAVRLAHACKAKASDTYIRVAEEGVQLHGGIGMTDEAEIGFHLKAARVAELEMGDGADHRRRYAATAGY